MKQGNKDKALGSVSLSVCLSVCLFTCLLACLSGLTAKSKGYYKCHYQSKVFVCNQGAYTDNIACAVYWLLTHDFNKGWSNILDGFHNPYTVRIAWTPPTHPQILTSTIMKSVHIKNSTYLLASKYDAEIHLILIPATLS